MRHIVRVGAVALFLALSSSASAEEVGTLTLDGLSFVSFQDREVVALPAGSTLRFRFGRASGGSVSFSIDPADVSIPDVPIPGSNASLRYRLGSTANGTVRKTTSGVEVSFSATVVATTVGIDGGSSNTYALTFTTESATAPSSDGSASVQITGMKLVAGANHVQLVGATTNKANAVPEPGAAVYAVLSGTFDRVPSIP